MFLRRKPDYPINQQQRKTIERRIGYKFRKPELLVQALTHSSYAHAHPPHPDNERLEFLGDSVLGLIMAETLYKQHPTFTEGDMTKLKSQIVSQVSLQAIARTLNLDTHLLTEGHGALQPSSLCGAFESLLGAIYLDGGLKSAQKFLSAHLQSTVSDIESGRIEHDPKSALQELSLRQFHSPPRYRIIAERGPAHAKQFEVHVLIRGQYYATGVGRSKKTAEQSGAQAALQMLREGQEPRPESRREPRHEPRRHRRHRPHTEPPQDGQSPGHQAVEDVKRLDSPSEHG